MKILKIFGSFMYHNFSNYPIVATTVSLSSLLCLPMYFVNKDISMKLEKIDQELKEVEQKSNEIVFKLINKSALKEAKYNHFLSNERDPSITSSPEFLDALKFLNNEVMQELDYALPSNDSSTYLSGDNGTLSDF